MISGTYFKHLCKYRVGNYINPRNLQWNFEVDDSLDNNLVFVNTALINHFTDFVNQYPDYLPETITLVLHNSDHNVTPGFCVQIRHYIPRVKRIYTQNLIKRVKRVRPIPIGIANPKWSHGNVDRFKEVMKEDIKKTKSVYINFNISTNPKERQYCLEQTGAALNTIYPNAASIRDHDDFVNKTQHQYLRNIAKSRFTVSPDGNGKDCHKTWEALYMRSIPIVTRSYFAEKFRERGVPMVILDDWSEYKHLSLSEVDYDCVWGGFDIAKLDDPGFWIKELR